jgi:hypothetical protein
MSEQCFFLVYRVSSVSTDNILMWICGMLYAIRSRRFTVDYLCVLFLGDGFKPLPRHIILQQVGGERKKIK